MPEPRIVESTHRDGWPHARSTVLRMANLAREAAQSYEIRSLATAIVQDVPSKQTTAELAALYRWVRDHIRYRFDPVGVEWLQSPSRTLREGAGDCDDLATLLAALAESLGHETRYHVVGPDADTPHHVAVEAWDGSQWVALDPVLEQPAMSTDPREDLGEFGNRAEGHLTYFNHRGSQLGSYQHDVELWRWRPLAYTDSGLLVPIDSRYATDGYNFPGGGMPPDAILPSGMLGAQFMPANTPPCVVLPRGMMGAVNCTCPMSDRRLGLGYWVKEDEGSLGDILDKIGGAFEDAYDWGKGAVEDIGEAFEDGWDWAKNAVSDSVDWLKQAYEDVMGVLSPIADVALVLTSVPGLQQVLSVVVPGGAIIVPAVQKWAASVQKLNREEGVPLDQAANMAFGELSPEAQKALEIAPESLAQFQNMDLSVLKEAGLDADVLDAVEQVRGNIPPDIDFSKVANELPSAPQPSPEPTPEPAPQPEPPITATAAVGPPIKKVAESTPPEPPQVQPVPADADPLIQFTDDVIQTAQTDPEEAGRLIESGIQFAMSSAFPRQQYDSNSGLYRIYAPVLSGLGAAPARSDELRELAFSAGTRVAKIIEESGRPPTAPVPEVAEFQAAVDTPDDGLWGPNTRLAVSYYAGVPLEDAPEVHPAFADTPMTWEPPESPEPEAAPVVEPAPTPTAYVPESQQESGPTTVVAESTPRQPGDPPPPEPEPEPSAAPPRSDEIRELAFQAGTAVADIIDQSGMPPAQPVPEVAEFQAAVGTPDDGLWGPNTRLAASYYLTMPLEETPEVHPAFADTPMTWEPPESPQPAPEPSVAPLPEPPPEDRPVIDVTGPEIVPEPEPPPPAAPPPEPSPPPPTPPPPTPPEAEGGYREVGTSPVDPGLPELDTGEVKPRKAAAGAGGAWALLASWIIYETAY